MLPLFLAWRVKKLIREGGTLRVRYVSSRTKYSDFYSQFLNFNVFFTSIPPRAAPGAPFYIWTTNENMLGS